jgi:hypothetical protein
MSGELVQTELYIYTDNTTAEGAYYKGNSPNRHLFSLVLRLRLLEMQASIQLHVIHVAGTRMIYQGTDGLSRGIVDNHLFHNPPTAFGVPLHVTALARQPLLLPWIRSWAPEPDLTPLQPTEWFTKGHGIGSFCHNSDGILVPQVIDNRWLLWDLPPAAGRVALEQLALSRPKVLSSTTSSSAQGCSPPNGAACCINWLMSSLKFQQELAPSRPRSMHEPLLLGLTLRFISCPPWTLHRHSTLLDLVCELRSLWPQSCRDERHILRQLCNTPATLERMLLCVAWQMLHPASPGSFFPLCHHR